MEPVRVTLNAHSWWMKTSCRLCRLCPRDGRPMTARARDKVETLIPLEASACLGGRAQWWTRCRSDGS